MHELTEVTNKRPSLTRVWPLAVVAIFGLVIAIAAWVAASDWEQRLAKAKFNDVAGDYATVLQNGLDHYVGELATVRAFYDASVYVDSEEFKVFTHRILDGHSQGLSHDHMMRITWSPLVTQDDRVAFERGQSARVGENFTITGWSLAGPIRRASRHAEYFPVLFATDPSAESSLIGMDLYTEAVRRGVIMRAIATDRTTAAQNVILRANGDGEKRGVFIALPVYNTVPRTTWETMVRGRAVIFSGFLAGRSKPKR